MTTPAQRDEVSRILALTKGDSQRAFEVVERQLSVLVLRTQVMLSLSGIVIALAAAATAIGGVLRLRWLTQALRDDISDTLGRMLEIRDTKSRFLSAALVLFIVGFSCDCIAIAQMVMNVELAG